VRSAQLGWGKHTTSAAQAKVTASLIPTRRLPGALGLRCRPRYRSWVAWRPPLSRTPLT
jgi:hypothetical protein